MIPTEIFLIWTHYFDFSSPCFHVVTFKDGGRLLCCESHSGFFTVADGKFRDYSNGLKSN
jgi:hypothetical protein